jgi:hypothetical protein
MGRRMGDEILERNKNLNRGFRKLLVWREAIDLYVFEKKILDQIRGISFKIKDQINPRAKPPRRKERRVIEL